MSNYYNSHMLQANMVDGCEESSSDYSDSISGNNSSFYADSSSSEENLQYEEPSEESNSFLKCSAKQKSMKWQSKIRETVILAGNVYIKIVLHVLVKMLLHKNGEAPCSE